jgi:hypothetical protein
MNVTDIVFPAGVVAAIFIALLKVILLQNEKRQDERFLKLEKSREEASKHWDERYGKTEEAVQQLAERMAKVETNVAHVPSREEISTIREGIAKIGADNESQTALLRRLENQLALIHEWMLRNNK